MSTLIVRNFKIGKKRSSLKLELELWQSLANISKKMQLPESLILTALAEYKSKTFPSTDDSTFTSMVRVFIIKALNAIIGGKWTPKPILSPNDIHLEIHQIMGFDGKGADGEAIERGSLRSVA
jgi:predicted DNA-binding ribbon-helix-helix protein